jgi:hypothetical protein
MGPGEIKESLRDSVRDAQLFHPNFVFKFQMQTGQGDLDTSAIISSALDIFKPVMESAAVLAAHYAKACGRDVVLSQDMHMGMMFAARNVTGRHVGSLFPEIYEESEESDRDSEESESCSDSDGSWETVSDSELAWTRYDGQDDEQALAMNACADSWASWEPETPAERALKNAIDKMDQN